MNFITLLSHVMSCEDDYTHTMLVLKKQAIPGTNVASSRCRTILDYHLTSVSHESSSIRHNIKNQEALREMYMFKVGRDHLNTSQVVDLSVNPRLSRMAFEYLQIDPIQPFLVTNQSGGPDERAFIRTIGPIFSGFNMRTRFRLHDTQTTLGSLLNQ